MVLDSMDNKKDDNYYFQKALEEINTIQAYCIGKTYDEFISNQEALDATMFRLIQMIENIKNISPEYQSRHSDIKWGKIIGFRNGIVHEYGETDYTIVYQIVTKGISELKELFISELNS